MRRVSAVHGEYMVLFVGLIAVLAASWMVPAGLRADWRRDWIAQIRHYNTLLLVRGVKNRYVWARIRHHSISASLDAWRLRMEAPSTLQLRSAIRKSGFCLSLIALGMGVIVGMSRGLAITRAMLAPRNAQGERLVLIFEAGAFPGEQYPIPARLLDFWKTHNNTFDGLAGYQFNSRGTAWVTPEFFDVLGSRPRQFLLHSIHEWRPAVNQEYLGVIGRLKPGITLEAAQGELRDLASAYGKYRRPPHSQPAQVVQLLGRIRRPLRVYGGMCALVSTLLLIAAGVGIRADSRRSGRIRGRFWAYFCVKSVVLPLALALVIWEFSRATSFTLTGGATFVAEPLFVWLVILASAAIVWWCLTDQRARCRACLQKLQYPVLIGSRGAVLFDHAGLELVCCQGHGALYLPTVSSDYVQQAGWTALDSAFHS